MVTADLRESGCERGGRAAILVQYVCIFLERALQGAAHHTPAPDVPRQRRDSGELWPPRTLFVGPPAPS